MKHLLAVDLGSSHLKCALYREDLTLVAHSVEPLELRIEGTHVENEPEDWWRALRQAVPRLLKDAGVEASAVAALTFCAQMQGVVLVDRELKAIRRSIGFMDTRGIELFAEGMQRGLLKLEGVNAWKLLRSAYATNIAPGSPKDTLWKVKWIERHEPENFARAHLWLDVKDYLVARCTGRAGTTADSAHLTCLYEFKGAASRYDAGLCRLYGIDPKLLPEVIAGNQVVGGLLPLAAQELGLKEGTPVVPGGGDISCVAFGTGAIAEGDTHVYLGTSAWVAQSTRKRKLDVAHLIASLRTCLPQEHLYMGELQTAGLCLSWAAKLLGKSNGESSDFSALEAEASSSPPGARGVLFTPWLHGSRSPNEDAFARGTFFNLGLAHQRGDLLRAVFEGVALHLGWILEAIETKMPAPGALRFVGGGALSPLWAQCLADVTGRTIETIDAPQLVGTRGAALLAAAATQPGVELQTLAREIKAARAFSPAGANRELYRAKLALLKQMYRANRPVFRTLSPSPRGGEGRGEG